MKDFLKLLMISSFCLLSSVIKSQTLTEKDFRLLLDGRSFKDSTITIDEATESKTLECEFFMA